MSTESTILIPIAWHNALQKINKQPGDAKVEVAWFLGYLSGKLGGVIDDKFQEELYRRIDYDRRMNMIQLDGERI